MVDDMLFVTRVTYGGVGGLQIDFVYTHMDIYVDWVYGCVVPCGRLTVMSLVWC